MRILGISGSLRSGSSTSAIVRAAGRLLPEGIDFAIYDGVGDLPHFIPDLDTDEPPVPVQLLRDAIAAADALLICTPEYAHGMPGSLKNMLDWLVSWPGFVDKRVAVMSASPSAQGGDYAHAWLLQTVTVMSANVIAEASLMIPYVKKKLDATGELADEETERLLAAAVKALAKK
jgi:chromate reductase